jgi:SAM-dependent methyltransferase
MTRVIDGSRTFEPVPPLPTGERRRNGEASMLDQREKQAPATGSLAETMPAVRATPRAERILACPYCHARLAPNESGASCSNPACGGAFGRSSFGLLDLRLQRSKTLVRRIVFGGEIERPVLEKRTLPSNPRPEVDWTGVDRPATLRPRLQSWLPRARKPGALALDIGCGSASFRPIFARSDFGYVGIDVAGHAATFLADARALPFCDDSFELVWSNAVLQYVPHPEIAIVEAFRVLEPGGLFMGTIGFLEAFDGDNMHQTTWLGAHRYFQDAGFKVEHLAPDDVWTGPVALARTLFPGLPGRSADLLVVPVDWCSRLYWRLATLRGRLRVEDRLVKITGGFEFILKKP